MNETQRISGKPLIVAIIVLVPIVATAIYLYRADVEIPSGGLSSDVAALDQRIVSIGGVSRPASDLANRWQDEASPDSGYMVNTDAKLIYGNVPQTARDANPAVAGIFEAIEQRSNPERLSPMIVPEEFNRRKYLADPKTYLAQHVPGRVWQTAQPGPDVPVLERISSPKQVMKFGEAIRLKVKAEPLMPVTFTSFDIGTFDNGLASITVAADEQGFAEANFNSSSGKVGEINLLAASPVAAEQVKFDVYVTPPSKKTP